MVEIAANNTSAVSGIVGIQKMELVKSIGTLLKVSARQPGSLTKHFGQYGKELIQIAKGTSEVKPSAKDRRFKDTAWNNNPVYKKGLQSWLAMRKEVKDWIDDAGVSDIDKSRAHFVFDLISDSLAPTNTLLGNPAAVKKLFDSGGTSIVSGLKNAYEDLVNNTGLPSQIDPTPFTVGENIAATEGSVVYKNEVLELLQYHPITPNVYKIPILICPPQINKYYVFDLSEEKSMVRFLTSRGYQVFMVSWRNPTRDKGHWGLETYVDALISASDAMMKITKSKSFNTCGACSGGITLSTFLSELAARGDKRVNSFTLQVCVLDSKISDSDIGLFLTDSAIERVRKKSRKKGVLEGKELAKTFAWMRPNDLIWNYVVNNYLMGEKPPAFDVLFWNSDATNLPAKLHSDYLDMFSDKRFQADSHVEFMGHPLDLTKITLDGFIQGAVTDHITPWKAVYRNTHLFGGNIEFILSNSGHIQSLVNPPGNPKAQFFANKTIEESPDDWMKNSKLHSDSWWLYWDKWLSPRSGEKKKAPAKLGNSLFPAGIDAPGEYVFQ